MYSRGSTGRIERIGGVECYVATPTGNYAKDKVVLFLADAFGLALVNNKVRTPALSYLESLLTNPYAAPCR